MGVPVILQRATTVVAEALFAPGALVPEEGGVDGHVRGLCPLERTRPRSHVCQSGHRAGQDTLTDLEPVARGLLYPAP